MASTSLERQVGDLLSAARVPGLAVAVVRNGKLDHVVSLGLRDVRSRAPIDPHTVFEAASLSKPVFAYAILKMVDAGMLSLDEPLPVGDLMVPDPRMSQITVRHILSHRSGLPNWQSESRPLRTYFKPGARFSYSGEGFALLQKVVEGRTDEALEAVMDRLVFGPLGMLESSYVWRESFESNHAAPHDEGLGLRPKFKPTSANAAFSLHTTAEDYGRFLEAVMSGDGLAPATARYWLEPAVHPPVDGFLSLDGIPRQLASDVAWGLGWGLEPSRSAFFHWGANDHARAYVIGCPLDGRAFVAFMNGENGFALVPTIAHFAAPGDHPSFRWLGIVE